VSLRIAALGLLAERPGSGYDLLDRFRKSLANVWPATQSQLYGELNKLSDAGLIEVSAVGPRGRKEYRVTAAGRAELLRWITSPQEDPPLRRPDLLRVFLLGEIPRDEARKYVSAFAEHAESELGRLEHIRDSAARRAENPNFYARAALEYGLLNARMEAQWAHWLLTEMDQQTDMARNKARNLPGNN
jgi:DNA-binding PadR family transcriptional regulator